MQIKMKNMSLNNKEKRAVRFLALLAVHSLRGSKVFNNKSNIEWSKNRADAFRMAARYVAIILQED
jgi:hypothetical protein